MKTFKRKEKIYFLIFIILPYLISHATKMLSNLVKAIRNKPEPELPSYVNFDEPLGVLKEFAEHEGLIEAQMALQGGGLNPTHEGFVKVSDVDRQIAL